MDRETRDQYVLVIQAKDMVGQMGGLSGTTSVTVTLTDVNDNPPRFTHSKVPFLFFSRVQSIKLVTTAHIMFLSDTLKTYTLCFICAPECIFFFILL